MLIAWTCQTGVMVAHSQLKAKERFDSESDILLYLNNREIKNMSPVRYFVVKSGDEHVSHFKTDAEAQKFLASEFFVSTYKTGIVDNVAFEIFETADEAENNSVQRLRESGMAKLQTLSKKEAIALGVQHLLEEPKVEEPVVKQ